MSNTFDSIAGRSSTRSYRDTPLSEEELNRLLTAGLQAPTATNRQELHFTVLSGRHPILAEIENEKNRTRHLNPTVNFYYNAPTVILISGEKGFKWSFLDAGIAVENIALAAEAMGLGSVIVGCIYDTLRGERRAMYEKALAFPEGYEFEIAIAVGHKAGEKTPHTFEKAKQITFLSDSDHE